VIDGGIFLGRNPSNGNVLNEEDIINFLDKHSIRKALVAPYKSIFFDYKQGNEELIRFYQRYPDRIIPVAFVQPNGFDIVNDAAYFANLRKSGVRVLGIYLAPKYYDIQLESFLVKSMVEKAVHAGLILQFGLQSVADLYKVADYYAHLKSPILIRWMSGRGYNALAEMLNLGRRCRNFYFDIGSLTCSGGISRLAEGLGSYRLYFTSNIPESFSLSSHFLLQSASLSRQDMDQIYSGTLNKILSLKSSHKGKIFDAKPWARIFDPFRKQLKIDTHWHTDGWNILEPEKDYDHFRQQFDRLHYEKVILSSIRALNDDFVSGNKELFDCVSQDPRLYGLAVVDPTRTKESLAQIEKYSRTKKCAGIKTIQDLYGIGLDHESYRPILKKAREKNLPVMAHIPGMGQAAQLNPDVAFICAHSTYGRVKNLFKYPNIFFDIATSHHDIQESQFEAMIREGGEDRILFASDGPLVDPSWTLGKLASCRFSQDQLEKILFFNALKAFPMLVSKKDLGRTHSPSLASAKASD